MQDTQENKRRVDDSFFRKVMSSLAIIIVVESLAGIYYYGKLNERVDWLESELTELHSIKEDLADISGAIAILNNNVNSIGNTVKDTAKTLDFVKATQNKSINIIKDSREHIKNRKIHGTQKR